MKKMYVFEGTKAQLENLKVLAGIAGIKLEELDGAQTEASQPKAEKAPKTSKKSSKKKSGTDFPHSDYVAMAKKLGCLSKKGIVWRSCRSIVYDAIGWDVESNTLGKPKLTEAKAKKAVADVKSANGWK